MSEEVKATFADAIRTLEQHWYTDGELAQWLETPQPQFDGLSAIEMLAAGRKDAVGVIILPAPTVRGVC